MSAYGKPQQPNLHGYGANQTSFSYGIPVYGTQAGASSSSVAPVYQDPTSMTQITYAANQTRETYDDQPGAYLNVGSTIIPKFISLSPHKAPQGTQIHVGIASQYELKTSTNIPRFYLMFGNKKFPASWQKVSGQGAVCSYRITAEAPQFLSLQWNSTQVPVYLFMEADDGDVIAKLECGQFTYLDGVGHSRDSQQEFSRKRKLSTESAEMMKTPGKRVSSQQLRPKDDYNTYTYMSTDGNAFQTPYQQSSPSSYGGLVPQYNRPTVAYQTHAPPRHMGYNYSNSSSNDSPTAIKAEPAQVSTWSPGYSAMGSSLVRSPAVPSNAGLSRQFLSGAQSPAIGGNPPLIRTTTLQQTPSPATTPQGGHSGQTYHPYALYPHKAKLDINGNLDAMIQSWTPEEWESKRRLVLFRRSQSGSTISTNFHPVSAEDRPQNSACISCIYWEERREYFVTSVDTIYLLEQLVAAKFTVEEKNRIRRNLEGFRPLTVSKGKPDSEEFFKVIMAFPTPKPRNIEKDVKVFHWKDLSSALRKIIGKYSASPASTVQTQAPLHTPVSSTGYATEGSSAALSYVSDKHGGVSPQSISGSTTSTAYNDIIPARVLSPQQQKSMANLQSGPPDLRVSVPHHPHEGSNHWQGRQQQHHMPTPQQYQQQQQQVGNHSARGSWDMSSYLENSPATAAGSSSLQPLGYSSSSIRNVADAAVPGDDRSAQTLLQRQSHS